MIHHIVTRHTMTLPSRHTHPYRPVTRTLLMAAVTAALAGCGSLGSVGSTLAQANPVSWITPYKADVIQGNFVSKEQVDALKVGMPRAQVKDILGTPLVSSIFHADRWDYVFTLRRQGTASQVYKYAVFFNGDQLTRFEGDAMPSEAEFIASLVNTRKLGKVPVLEASEDQLKAAEKTAPRGAATAAAGTTASAPDAPRVVVYPPLESPKQ